jgi:hypothetical protein
MTQAAVKKMTAALPSYNLFFEINGKHTLKKDLPSFCVNYAARNRSQGKVAFFNFELAKEMGLIDQNHDHVMNSRLEKILLETFSLRIINEYDIAKKRSYKKIPNRNYMATRYLQLQHKSKTGKTSGDGCSKRSKKGNEG